jgi:hypothetical protein
MNIIGKHNENMTESLNRLEKSCMYKDLSCVLIVPALASVPTPVVSAWMNMFYPPNQRVARLFPHEMEVGAAYSGAIEMILAHKDLQKFKYIVTLEHDNTPPPDGLVRLLSAMEDNKQYSAIGGLYWTKGEGGVPQIWGNPKEFPLNMKPQPPVPDQLVECCGTGMGFTAFRTAMFRDENLRRPWFKTAASREEGVFTQDLYFWADAHKHGHRCAVDCSITVGHFDVNTGIIW